jgi:hypothetical protein
MVDQLMKEGGGKIVPPHHPNKILVEHNDLFIPPIFCYDKLPIAWAYVNGREKLQLLTAFKVK